VVNVARSNRLRPERLGLPAHALSQRQREILDKLEALFVEDGFASFTIGDMAAHVQCSRRTLYELAPTKEELVLVVVDRRFRRLGRLVRERLADLDDPLERLRLILSGDRALQLRVIGTRFRSDVARYPSVQRLIGAHFRYAGALIEDALDAGVAAGVFRPVNVQVLTEIIDASLARLQEPELLEATGMTFDECVAELLDLIEHALRRSPDA
jgi:AcrR family transcriptional regulator